MLTLSSIQQHTLEINLRSEASLTGQWSEYSSIISAGLSDAFEGKTTIEEAVKTIDEQANTTVFK